jgi:N-acetylglutamate synthase-like GNAT family acetyltransferase
MKRDEMAPRAEPDVVVRDATPDDQAAIVALVRSEHLNPNDLDWWRFVVAVDEQGLAGAVQLRENDDGSQELASLVVRADWRGLGIATRMIERLLLGRSGRIYAVTRHTMVAHFERWGFAPIETRQAPPAVRQRRLLGQLLGGLMSLLRRRRPLRLVVLKRRPQTNRNATLPSAP